MADVRRLVGEQFRGWKILRELGRGDSAIVYEAAQGEKRAAIKIFFPEALGKHGFDEETQRLELQLKLRGKRHHPNLVEIFDGGVAEELGNTLFLVMELVPGNTLATVVDCAPNTSIAPLIRQLAAAAQYLEQQGLVHRDIKPANIVVSDDFSRLTLLDLGILRTIGSDDAGRLSGNRFVATARYSPHEFVWRTEVESPEAWRAITFYQIGGVLHDLIMKKRLFDGQDEPPARLYDAIKLITPDIDANDCEPWLRVLAQCCLVKDWRERLKLVSWESFLGPATEAIDLGQRQRAVRVRQIRREEAETARQAQAVREPADRRIKDLWELQDAVFLETRRFLTGTQIFPRFSAQHKVEGQTRYLTTFDFESAPAMGFTEEIHAKVLLEWEADMGESTRLTVAITGPDSDLFKGTWLERLTVERAAAIIQEALVQVADEIVPKT